MLASEAWQKIVYQLSQAPVDVKTVPQRNRTPVWFNTSVAGNCIRINKAAYEKPSSNLTMPRLITFSDFERVYEKYLKWISGENNARSEAMQCSLNSSYIFALVEHFVLS